MTSKILVQYGVVQRSVQRESQCTGSEVYDARNDDEMSTHVVGSDNVFIAMN